MVGIDRNGGASIIRVVGIPMLLGVVSLGVCMAFYALAIHFEWTENLAPRAANRPKAVMKNAILYKISEKYKNKIYVYPIAWIIWAYNLTYKQCIVGIPGTGTRKLGWEGPLLKTNLDAVILLKFHTLLFKIALLVAFLCIFVLLPLNMYAVCDDDVFGIGTCKTHNQTVGFARTTIVNIPDKIYNNLTNVSVTVALSPSQFLDAWKPLLGINVTDDNLNITGVNVTINNQDLRSMFTKFWVADQSWRIYTTILCCMLIYVYTMYMLTQEWIENIALRRAFFLEASLYGERMIELNKLELDHTKKKKNHDYSEIESVSREYESKRLPAYLTHPEIRETPPSIGLYSVLFQLPQSMVTYDTAGATSLERQLMATTKFFDEIVPSQPGFSSSVVAVSMIPNAKLVAKTWNAWTKCEVKLQTLRRIRELIAKAKKKKDNRMKNVKRMKSTLLYSFENEDPANTEDPESTMEKAEIEAVHCTELDDEEGSSRPFETKVYGDGTDGGVERQHFDAKYKQHPMEATMSLKSEATAGNAVFKYEDFDVRVYAKSMGFDDEVNLMTDFVDGMDIEEFNVFAYNCAMIAGGPGFGKKVLNIFNVGTLLEEEKDVIEELKEAQEELNEARADVVAQDGDTIVGTDHDSIHSKQNLADLRQNAIQSSAIQSSISTRDINMLDSIVENDEWRVSESEFEETLQILEKKREIEREGKFKRLRQIMKRIFFGPDFLDFDPEFDGVETENKGKAFVTNVEHPSYAVVTFSSRHSAIIARQCLADGRAVNNWKQVDTIPTYPLADSPPLLFFPRGFMRPVTPAISYKSKKIRQWIVVLFLILFTSVYVVPINKINRFIKDADNYTQYPMLSGLLPILSGLTQTMLFSVCPQIFKFVANCEGSASSMAKAEELAILYFWYFYIIARFMGPILWDSIVKFTTGTSNSVEALILSALSDLAMTVPTTLAPAALTFIIFSATITWPTLYFLQLNNFLTSAFRLRWINRLLRGGGPGPEVPYRIYVDSGYVLSCMTAFAPSCPLIGPFALLYFIILSPMLRWLVLFAYRPRFDGGGDKWPKLHHIIITSLLLGQCITSISLVLKGNLLEGVIIGFWIVPTLLFDSIIKEKYLRQFHDASLRYTGKMYTAQKVKEEGKDSWPQREEFRRWLVDCHKASYLPTCLSGPKKNVLTAEPAMVIPKVSTYTKSVWEYDIMDRSSDDCLRNLRQIQNAQKGVIMRS